MKAIAFREVDAYTPRWFALLGALGLLVAVGLAAALYMEVNGHWVTGMDNQVVWGVPHVFAVFLIVAASGALNVASITSVFGKVEYKPLAPLSALLAIALLAGGLTVLVLDLGRPERLFVAMTRYNVTSIFAWNIILYNGFFAIVAVYLWLLLDRRLGRRYGTTIGVVAFLWRLILTTGTGSIFGFLVARDLYNAAIMAPLFVAMSFSFGLAVFVLVLLAALRLSGRAVGKAIPDRLGGLLAIFVAAVLYFTAVHHLTNLYMAERAAASTFVLADGGVHTLLFWGVQVGLGGLVPLVLLLFARCRRSLAVASALVVLGGLAQVYVIIIGGQAVPLDLLPGKEVVASSFFDGQVHGYVPTAPELLLGMGGVAVALLIVALGCTTLRLLPETLEDAA